MAIIPYLLYEDLGKALKWLEKAFGLKRFGASNRAPDGTLIHAAMRLPGGVVMMGAPRGKYKNPRRLGQATQCLYVNVARLDRHFQRAVEAGARIIEEPKDTPFGERRYGAEDLEGHQWYFAERAGRKSRKPRTRRKGA